MGRNGQRVSSLPTAQFQDRRVREDCHDYDNDPYFYTAPVYRYNRGGAYYETNQYGADSLRQAVNLGYQEGFRAGAADREDNWRPDYRNSFAYQDATYGYYTLGKMEILKLREDYKKKLGSAFTLARFHHDLLQFGDPALPLLRPLLLGADDDGKILPDG